jgi:hypothetical protein
MSNAYNSMILLIASATDLGNNAVTIRIKHIMKDFSIMSNAYNEI